MVTKLEVLLQVRAHQRQDLVLVPPGCKPGLTGSALGLCEERHRCIGPAHISCGCGFGACDGNRGGSKRKVQQHWGFFYIEGAIYSKIRTAAARCLNLLFVPDQLWG